MKFTRSNGQLGAVEWVRDIGRQPVKLIVWMRNLSRGIITGRFGILLYSTEKIM